MAIVQTINIPNTTFPTGSQIIGPASVPAGVSQIAFDIPMTGLTLGTHYADFTLESSIDSGATWQLVGGSDITGSNVVNTKHGNTTDLYTRFGPLAEGSQVRVTLNVFVGFTLTGGFIDLWA